MAFPQTQERLSHGEACWFVAGKRMFVMFADHHHDDRVAFWAAADDGVQRHLVEDEPRQFFRPPYVGVRGWVGMWLDETRTGTASSSSSRRPGGASPVRG